MDSTRKMRRGREMEECTQRMQMGMEWRQTRRRRRRRTKEGGGVDLKDGDEEDQEQEEDEEKQDEERGGEGTLHPTRENQQLYAQIDDATERSDGWQWTPNRSRGLQRAIVMQSTAKQRGGTHTHTPTEKDVLPGPGGQCIYSRTPAMGLGLTAAVFTLTSQILANTLGGCICCKQIPSGSYPATCQRTLAALCLIFSWIIFTISFMLLIAGAGVNDEHDQSDVFTGCYIIKPGVFAGGAFLSFASTVLGIIYNFQVKALKRVTVHHNLSSEDYSTQPVIVPEQRRFIPQPIFIPISKNYPHTQNLPEGSAGSTMSTTKLQVVKFTIPDGSKENQILQSKSQGSVSLEGTKSNTAENLQDQHGSQNKLHESVKPAVAIHTQPLAEPMILGNVQVFSNPLANPVVSEYSEGMQNSQTGSQVSTTLPVVKSRMSMNEYYGSQ